MAQGTLSCRNAAVKRQADWLLEISSGGCGGSCSATATTGCSIATVEPSFDSKRQ
jgi:hypothetical protein